MEEQKTEVSRVCGCLACRNLEADIAECKLEAVTYGNCCANCVFYSIDENEASGVCCKFELSPGEGGMNLYHRKRGELRWHPLIVGAYFSCNSFRPVHEVPNLEAFWRSMPIEEKGESIK